MATSAVMEHDTYFQQVLNALDRMYAGNQDNADIFLQNFMQNPISWEMCDRVLRHQNLPVSHYIYAATTLIYRIRVHIADLSNIEAFVSLKDSLLSHIRCFFYTPQLLSSAFAAPKHIQQNDQSTNTWIDKYTQNLAKTVVERLITGLTILLIHMLALDASCQDTLLLHIFQSILPSQAILSIEQQPSSCLLPSNLCSLQLIFQIMSTIVDSYYDRRIIFLPHANLTYCYNAIMKILPSMLTLVKDVLPITTLCITAPALAAGLCSYTSTNTVKSANSEQQLPSVVPYIQHPIFSKIHNTIPIYTDNQVISQIQAISSSNNIQAFFSAVELFHNQILSFISVWTTHGYISLEYCLYTSSLLPSEQYRQTMQKQVEITLLSSSTIPISASTSPDLVNMCIQARYSSDHIQALKNPYFTVAESIYNNQELQCRVISTPICPQPIPMTSGLLDMISSYTPQFFHSSLYGLLLSQIECGSSQHPTMNILLYNIISSLFNQTLTRKSLESLPSTVFEPSEIFNSNTNTTTTTATNTTTTTTTIQKSRKIHHSTSPIYPLRCFGHLPALFFITQYAPLSFNQFPSWLPLLVEHTLTALVQSFAIICNVDSRSEISALLTSLSDVSQVFSTFLPEAPDMVQSSQTSIGILSLSAVQICHTLALQPLLYSGYLFIQQFNSLKHGPYAKLFIREYEPTSIPRGSQISSYIMPNDQLILSDNNNNTNDPIQFISPFIHAKQMMDIDIFNLLSLAWEHFLTSIATHNNIIASIEEKFNDSEHVSRMIESLLYNSSSSRNILSPVFAQVIVLFIFSLQMPNYHTTSATTQLICNDTKSITINDTVDIHVQKLTQQWSSMLTSPSKSTRNDIDSNAVNNIKEDYITLTMLREDVASFVHRFSDECIDDDLLLLFSSLYTTTMDTYYNYLVIVNAYTKSLKKFASAPQVVDFINTAIKQLPGMNGVDLLQLAQNIQSNNQTQNTTLQVLTQTDVTTQNAFSRSSFSRMELFQRGIDIKTLLKDPLNIPSLDVPQSNDSSQHVKMLYLHQKYPGLSTLEYQILEELPLSAIISPFEAVISFHSMSLDEIHQVIGQFSDVPSPQHFGQSSSSSSSFTKQLLAFGKFHNNMIPRPYLHNAVELTGWQPLEGMLSGINMLSNRLCSSFCYTFFNRDVDQISRFEVIYELQQANYQTIQPNLHSQLQHRLYLNPSSTELSQNVGALPQTMAKNYFDVHDILVEQNQYALTHGVSKKTLALLSKKYNFFSSLTQSSTISLTPLQTQINFMHEVNDELYKESTRDICNEIQWMTFLAQIGQMYKQFTSPLAMNCLNPLLYREILSFFTNYVQLLSFPISLDVLPSLGITALDHVFPHQLQRHAVITSSSQHIPSNLPSSNTLLQAKFISPSPLSHNFLLFDGTFAMKTSLTIASAIQQYKTIIKTQDTVPNVDPFVGSSFQYLPQYFTNQLFARVIFQVMLPSIIYWQQFLPNKASVIAHPSLFLISSQNINVQSPIHGSSAASSSSGNSEDNSTIEYGLSTNWNQLIFFNDLSVRATSNFATKIWPMLVLNDSFHNSRPTKPNASIIYFTNYQKHLDSLFLCLNSCVLATNTINAQMIYNDTSLLSAQPNFGELLTQYASCLIDDANTIKTGYYLQDQQIYTSNNNNNKNNTATQIISSPAIPYFNVISSIKGSFSVSFNSLFLITQQRLDIASSYVNYLSLYNPQHLFETFSSLLSYIHTNIVQLLSIHKTFMTTLREKITLLFLSSSTFISGTDPSPDAVIASDGIISYFPSLSTCLTIASTFTTTLHQNYYYTESSLSALLQNLSYLTSNTLQLLDSNFHIQYKQNLSESMTTILNTFHNILTHFNTLHYNVNTAEYMLRNIPANYKNDPSYIMLALQSLFVVNKMPQLEHNIVDKVCTNFISYMSTCGLYCLKSLPVICQLTCSSFRESRHSGFIYLADVIVRRINNFQQELISCSNRYQSAIAAHISPDDQNLRLLSAQIALGNNFNPYEIGQSFHDYFLPTVFSTIDTVLGGKHILTYNMDIFTQLGCNNTNVLQEILKNKQIILLKLLKTIWEPSQVLAYPPSMQVSDTTQQDTKILLQQRQQQFLMAHQQISLDLHNALSSNGLIVQKDMIDQKHLALFAGMSPYFSDSHIGATLFRMKNNIPNEFSSEEYESNVPSHIQETQENLFSLLSSSSAGYNVPSIAPTLSPLALLTKPKLLADIMHLVTSFIDVYSELIEDFLGLIASLLYNQIDIILTSPHLSQILTLLCASLFSTHQPTRKLAAFDLSAIFSKFLFQQDSLCQQILADCNNIPHALKSTHIMRHYTETQLSQISVGVGFVSSRHEFDDVLDFLQNDEIIKDNIPLSRLYVYQSRFLSLLRWSWFGSFATKTGNDDLNKVPEFSGNIKTYLTLVNAAPTIISLLQLSMLSHNVPSSSLYPTVNTSHYSSSANNENMLNFDNLLPWDYEELQTNSIYRAWHIINEFIFQHCEHFAFKTPLLHEKITIPPPLQQQQQQSQQPQQLTLQNKVIQYLSQSLDDVTPIIIPKSLPLSSLLSYVVLGSPQFISNCASILQFLYVVSSKCVLFQNDCSIIVPQSSKQPNDASYALLNKNNILSLLTHCNDENLINGISSQITADINPQILNNNVNSWYYLIPQQQIGVSFASGLITKSLYLSLQTNQFFSVFSTMLNTCGTSFLTTPNIQTQSPISIVGDKIAYSSFSSQPNVGQLQKIIICESLTSLWNRSHIFGLFLRNFISYLRSIKGEGTSNSANNTTTNEIVEFFDSTPSAVLY